MSKNSELKVIIPEARLSYPVLWEPEQIMGNGEKKYQATFIIQKSNKKVIKQMKNAIKEAAIAEWGKIPAKLQISALKDGAEKEGAGYGEDIMFIPATNKRRPVIVDRKKRTLVEEDDVIYAGCYVQGVVNAFAWDFNGKKGISASLEIVRFLKDGEPFGSNTASLDDLDDLDDDDLDDDDDDIDDIV